MTEPATPEPGTPQQQGAGPGTTAPPPAEPTDKMVPASRLKVVEENAGEWKRKATEAEKRLAEYDNAKRAAEEAEALKRGESEKLIAERDKRIADLEVANAAAALAVRRESARALLIGRNMTSKLAQEGALLSVPAEGDLSEWIESLAKENPEVFSPATKPTIPGVSGSVASTQASGTLKERLESQDDATRAAAMAEAKKALFAGVTG